VNPTERTSLCARRGIILVGCSISATNAAILNGNKKLYMHQCGHLGYADVPILHGSNGDVDIKIAINQNAGILSRTGEAEARTQLVYRVEGGRSESG
jgi:hypothetical protein